MNLRFFLALLTSALFCFFYPSTSFAATEPAANTMPSIVPPGANNYFDLTVNYTVPADANGVLVVVRQTYSPIAPPADNTLYTANARIGAGDTTRVCAIYCEWVVADATANGSVTVSGLKAGTKHYFAVYAYNKISGTDINYNQTISPAINVASATTTAASTAAGRSHNELWVAANSPKDGVNWGTETSADCVTACHAQHHTAQMLPRGQAQMDACVTCHNGTSATDNIGLHPADGSVDCGSCHSLHSFKTEELYSTDPSGNKAFNLSFVRKNMSKYINPTMYPPPAGGGTTTALDNTVFQDRATDYAFKNGSATYNAVCQTCHTTAAHHTQTSSDNHHVNATTGANDPCTGCHNHKGGFAPTGGHDATHFAWTLATTTSCGAADCHNAAVNTNVVEQVHNGRFVATNAAVTNNCMNCHDNASGGSQTTRLGPTDGDGDARLASDAPLGPGKNLLAECTVCHTKTKTAIHHTTLLNTLTTTTAQNGYCDKCHIANVGETTNPQTRALGNLAMPTNLPCNFCHLYFPNKAYTKVSNKVQIYRLSFNPNTGNNHTGWAAPVALATHAVSEITNPPIRDYSACFACHGKTGVDNGRTDAAGADRVKPFHGLGAPYTGDNWLTGGDASDHINQYFSTTSITGANQAVRSTAYHPGAINFNSLGQNAGPGRNITIMGYTATKNYTDSCSGCSPYSTGKPAFHKLDPRAHERVDAVYGASTANDFQVPWDNFADNVLAPGAGSITVNLGNHFAPYTGSPTVPLAPLTLP